MSASTAPTAVPATQAPPSQANAQASCDRGGAPSDCGTQPQSLRRHWKQMILATLAPMWIG